MMSSGFDEINFHPSTRFSGDPAPTAKEQARRLLAAERGQANQRRRQAARKMNDAQLYRKQLIDEIAALQGAVFRLAVGISAWNCTFLSRWRKRAGYYLGPEQHRVDFWLGANGRLYYSNDKWRVESSYERTVYYKSLVKLKHLQVWQLERLRDQLAQAKNRLSWSFNAC